MLNYAGEVLLALGLVLFSLLSYWLVWKLNGLGKFPEPQSNCELEKKVEWADIIKQIQGDSRNRCLRSTPRQSHPFSSLRLLKSLEYM
jgi:hypothetical protein